MTAVTRAGARPRAQAASAVPGRLVLQFDSELSQNGRQRGSGLDERSVLFDFHDLSGEAVNRHDRRGSVLLCCESLCPASGAGAACGSLSSTATWGTSSVWPPDLGSGNHLDKSRMPRHIFGKLETFRHGLDIVNEGVSWLWQGCIAAISEADEALDGSLHPLLSPTRIPRPM